LTGNKSPRCREAGCFGLRGIDSFSEWHGRPFTYRDDTHPAEYDGELRA
jgi:hypothetical protein